LTLGEALVNSEQLGLEISGSQKAAEVSISQISGTQEISISGENSEMTGDFISMARVMG
jgi:hypothetical protein